MIEFLSSFVLIIILMYGTAVVVGRVKELNKLLKQLVGDLFKLLLDIIGGIFSFIFRQLRELHKKCYQANALVTVIAELFLIMLIILLIILRR